MKRLTISCDKSDPEGRCLLSTDSVYGWMSVMEIAGPRSTEELAELARRVAQANRADQSDPTSMEGIRRAIADCLEIAREGLHSKIIVEVEEASNVGR